jgi:hypothetical protein
MATTQGALSQPIKLVLFPGKSSYPISPCSDSRLIDKKTGISKTDQMTLISKMYGKATDEDLSFLTDEEAKIFMKNISKKFEGHSFASLLPGCKNQDLLSLLESMLQFNPFYRCSAQEAL